MPTKLYLQVIVNNYDEIMYDTAQLSVIRGGSELARTLPSFVYTSLCKNDDYQVSTISDGGSNGLFEITATGKNKEPDPKKKINKSKTSKSKTSKSNTSHSNTSKSNTSKSTTSTEQNELSQDKLKILSDAVTANVQDCLHKHPAMRFIPVTLATSSESTFEKNREKLRAHHSWQRFTSHSIPMEFNQPKQKVGAEHSVCGLNGLRKTFDTEGKSPDMWFSEFTGARLSLGRELRSRGNLFKNLIQYSTGSEQPPEFDWDGPDDLGDIADTSGRTEGKLAYIYFDGNSFGNARKQNSNNAEQLKEFNDYLQHQRASLLEKLVADFTPPTNTKSANNLIRFKNGKKYLAVEPLLWGGDESLLAVPASAGLAVLWTLLKYTEGWKKGSSMTHAFGILFCHFKTPVADARNMAEKLAENAKKITRKRNSWASASLKSIDSVPMYDMKQYFHSRFGNFQGTAECLSALGLRQDKSRRDKSKGVNRDDGIYSSISLLLRLPRGQIRRIAEHAARKNHEYAKLLEKRMLGLLVTDVETQTTKALTHLADTWLPDKTPDKTETTEDRLVIWMLVEELYDFLPSQPLPDITSEV